MNNNIQEDYCSFEVSKLLKEKGFDCKCDDCFNNHGMLYSNGWCEYIDDRGVDKPFNHHTLSLVDLYYILRPTHALAIKWIRENFGIHIYTHGCGMGFYCYVLQRADGVKNSIIKSSYGGPKEIDGMFSYVEQAIEAALLYILKNLI